MDLEESFSVIFATAPDEECLIAELYAQDRCVIEIHTDDLNDFDVRFVDDKGQKLGELKLSRLESMIKRAKEGLPR